MTCFKLTECAKTQGLKALRVACPWNVQPGGTSCPLVASASSQPSRSRWKPKNSRNLQKSLKKKALGNKRPISYIMLTKKWASLYPGLWFAVAIREAPESLGRAPTPPPRGLGRAIFSRGPCSRSSSRVRSGCIARADVRRLRPCACRSRKPWAYC